MSAQVPPLSEEERILRIRSEVGKASMHLREAETLSKGGGAPNACVHAAYYSMYHLAVAVLLVTGGVGRLGGVPKNHTVVGQEFAARVAQEPGELGEAGKLLGVALARRIDADYTLGSDMSASAATEATTVARHFAALCADRWPQLALKQ
ncbi:MAG: hypothetical protein HY834_17785 [Devosia nanyangense]|uniref:HEPN domain-containing protein n=1 Tax=Devosia nanyangense TaxID=1228055 RepID=A0A933L5S7_9HYPH|nr:hypothetical protein [Devosia nanyangense]